MLQARSVMEHLGSAPGHADRPCGPCDKAQRMCGWYCAEWDAYLRTGSDGKPVKTFDCCRSADRKNTLKERND